MNGEHHHSRRRMLPRWLSGALSAFRSHRAIWEQGVEDELEFWDAWARTRGLDWPQEFAERLDPQTPLQPHLCALLDPERSVHELLDVGAGPLTCLGKKWGGRMLRIRAIDPLAEQYRRILDKYGIVPLVVTEKGEAEQLTVYYPADHFDLVHARNCLDHSYDPEAAIRQMLGVVKPGGSVWLEHRINEGRNVEYEGLHQWNFYASRGEFCIASRRRTRNMTRRLAALCQVECNENDGWITVKLRKGAG